MVRNILLVDDDMEDIELLTAAVVEINPAINCDYALNGQVAIHGLENGNITRPELIIVDINMPVMNGWEFLQRIKSTPTLKDIPVIVYSTSDREPGKSMAIQLGALDYIRKPETYGNIKKALLPILLSTARYFRQLFNVNPGNGFLVRRTWEIQ